MKSVVLYFAIAYNTCERYHKGVVQDAKFKKQKFLTLLDFSQKRLSFTKSIRRFKTREIRRYRTAKLKGKNIALIFEKDSTRTRCAFETAAYDQGAHVTYLGPTGSQMGKKNLRKILLVY